MPNSRSVTPDAWEHARQALVFYFARRVRNSRAEDLAQETLLTVWTREDYEFTSAEDFLRVCYGFAGKILLKDRRDAQKLQAEASVPLQPHDRPSLPAGEAKVLLDQVCRIGRTQLRDQDWKLIEMATETDRAGVANELGLGDANNARVHLFRARNKLARLTWWRKERV